MTKPTLILQNSVIRIKLMKWLLPFTLFICLITIAKQWIRNDFAFDFFIFLQNGFLVFFTMRLVYLELIFIRERLTLDHTGIHYRSGKSLWKSTSDNDWHFHWENIQIISIV